MNKKNNTLFFKKVKINLIKIQFFLRFLIGNENSISSNYINLDIFLAQSYSHLKKQRIEYLIDKLSTTCQRDRVKITCTFLIIQKINTYIGVEYFYKY